MFSEYYVYMCFYLYGGSIELRPFFTIEFGTIFYLYFFDINFFWYISGTYSCCDLCMVTGFPPLFSVAVKHCDQKRLAGMGLF